MSGKCKPSVGAHNGAYDLGSKKTVHQELIVQDRAEYPYFVGSLVNAMDNKFFGQTLDTFQVMPGNAIFACSQVVRPLLFNKLNPQRNIHNFKTVMLQPLAHDASCDF